MNIFFKVLLIVFICGWASGYAQKLPVVQKESIYAPGNIKIDGKSTEWGDRYQAYDKKNNIFYTVSNDDKNLYLIIHTIEQNTINKIYVGGISFIITSLNHSNNTPLTITYPNKGGYNGLYLHAKHDYDLYKKDTIANAKNIKTLVQTKNTEFETTFKELRASNIKAINDPLLSIYNTEGIKVKSLLDSHFTYTYELALPLKYLDATLINSGKFRYTIKLNGVYQAGSNHPPPPEAHIIRPDGSEYIDMNMLYTRNPTEFSGEYTLAKK